MWHWIELNKMVSMCKCLVMSIVHLTINQSIFHIEHVIVAGHAVHLHGAITSSDNQLYPSLAAQIVHIDGRNSNGIFRIINQHLLLDLHSQMGDFQHDHTTVGHAAQQAIVCAMRYMQNRWHTTQFDRLTHATVFEQTNYPAGACQRCDNSWALRIDIEKIPN